MDLDGLTTAHQGPQNAGPHDRVKAVTHTNCSSVGGSRYPLPVMYLSAGSGSGARIGEVCQACSVPQRQDRSVKTTTVFAAKVANEGLLSYCRTTSPSTATTPIRKAVDFLGTLRGGALVTRSRLRGAHQTTPPQVGFMTCWLLSCRGTSLIRNTHPPRITISS